MLALRVACFEGKSPQGAVHWGDVGHSVVVSSVLDGGVHGILWMHRGERTPPDLASREGFWKS